MKDPFAFDLDRELSTQDSDALQAYLSEQACVEHSLDASLDVLEHQVDQIRIASALAKSAEERAKFATRVANGWKAKVNHRRAFVQSILGQLVQRGLIDKPTVKGLDYTATLKNSPGALEVDPSLSELIDNFNCDLQLQLTRALDAHNSDAMDLNKLRAYYLRLAELGLNSSLLEVTVKVSLKKTEAKTALSQGRLPDKLAALLKVVSQTILTLRL